MGDQSEPPKHKGARLQSHKSEAEQQGLTLHAHCAGTLCERAHRGITLCARGIVGVCRSPTARAQCAGYSTDLLMCMKEHGLPPDPYLRSVDDPEMRPCAAALDAFQRCGREFLDGVETTQLRCKAQVQAARASCSQKRPDCPALEAAALKCVGNRMRATMSTPAPPVTAYS